MTRSLCLVLVFIGLCVLTETSKILAVFPVPSISHQFFFRHITHELVKRGHEVTVITPDPSFSKVQAPANLSEIDVHDVSYSTKPRQAFSTLVDSGIYQQIEIGLQLVNNIFENQFRKPEIRKLMNENFDLLLLEACLPVTLALSHIIKVPVIQISSLGPVHAFEEIVGAPIHPFLYPKFYQQRLYNLSLWEKIYELYKYIRIYELYLKIEKQENEVIQRVFGPEMPPLSKLKENVDMVFLNAHPIWLDNQPTPPNVVYLGGLHKSVVKELTQNLQSYLDSSPNGVIYVSFGSNVQPSMLSPEKIRIFVKIFSQVPYNILWKWDQNELPGKPKNIKTAKWLPQTSILRHPNVKLFITQGGSQSTDEAIDAGVPLIGIPMIYDQWFNVEKYVHHKIGMKIELDTLNEAELGKAIETVIEDKTYRENILRYKLLINDTPLQPLENAMWWIEYVLRHGGASHLRSPAANMSWAQYFQIEFVLILFAAALATIIVSLYMLYYIYYLISRNFNTSIKMKED